MLLIVHCFLLFIHLYTRIDIVRSYRNSPPISTEFLSTAQLTDARTRETPDRRRRGKDTRHERTNRPTHAPRKNHLPHHTSHQSTARTDTCADAAPADWRSSEDNKQARRHTEREHRQRPSPATLNYHAPTPRTPRTPHNPPLRAGRGGDPGAHGMRATSNMASALSYIVYRKILLQIP